MSAPPALSCRPVYGRTAGRSIEVDPRISDDADRTAAEARGLWWLVDRPNLFIKKIAATVASLPAITASLADGISVNVTLIFSLDRYRAVLDAFLTGLEQRQAAGGSLAGIESVASFFISRVDTEVDQQLGLLTSKITAKNRQRNLTTPRTGGSRECALGLRDLQADVELYPLEGISGRRCPASAPALDVD
jgi:transaldolase